MKFYRSVVHNNITEIELVGKFPSTSDAIKAHPNEHLIRAGGVASATRIYFKKRVLEMGIKLKLKDRLFSCSEGHIDRLSEEDKYIWETFRSQFKLSHQLLLDL